ncbi:porin PorA family protein [Nocardioides sp. YIM 152315]|uniref:porin PorA family protein n=1 Tax=Nocardioides sp. YIM 152315 TaxID=3031760 RepID=UPI0023DA8182|nr:porin PorA family protein [Nocardioides sp. YIM 152315]MDF1603141.1 porin PorA family protein [Nocardioides sp. YIM 152315]
MLAFVGAFVIAVAVLGQTFLPDRLLETPLDAAHHRTMEGDAEVAGRTVPVRVSRVATVDDARSDGDVATWRRLTCAVVVEPVGTPDCLSSKDSDGRLLEATLDDIATDRRTGAAIDDPEYVPPDAQPRSGQVERWPSDARRADYSYWYEPAGAAIETAYDGTEEIGGVSCYRYVAELAGQSSATDTGEFAGYLSGTVTLWVEPSTGTIVRQAEDVRRSAGSPARITVESTAATVQAMADNARDLRDRVEMLTGTLPLVGYPVGVVLLLLAGVMVKPRRPRLPGQRRRAAESLPTYRV